MKVIGSQPIGKAIQWWFRDRIPHRKHRIYTSNSRITPETAASLFWGAYESAEIRFIRKHLNTNLDVIELGGGIGAVSCQILEVISNDSGLVVVEADPQLVDIARKNVALNYPKANCELVNVAIEYENPKSFVSFQRNIKVTEGNVKNKKTKIKGDRNKHDKMIRVRSERLESISQRFDEYALVSDIEGDEAGILFEKTNALACCKQIIIELHSTTYKGEPISIEKMVKKIENEFDLKERYGNVFFLRKWVLKSEVK
jgi:FkbM family methyltransferase